MQGSLNLTMQKIPWWRINFGEAEVQGLVKSIAHEHISQGPVVEEFEQAIAKKLDIPYVVATTSGSMALLMAMMTIGVGPGDEVIVPNRTWIATAHAPHLLGAKVILVDVEKDRPIMDPSQLETKITPRTKAIIPVHMNGRAASMKAIRQIAKKHGLFVVEDAAQALGSRNSEGFLGTQSDLGCFSLSVTKIISTGQGGFTVTHNRDFAEKLRSIRTHGVEDVLRATWVQPGFNFRYTDLLASVGLVQLSRLDEHIARSRAIYSQYVDGLKNLSGLKIIPVDLEGGEVPVYVEVLCSRRSELMGFLKDKGVDSRAFYPDLDTANYLSGGRFIHSRIFSDDGLYLPCGPDQALENVRRVIDTLWAFFGAVRSF